MSTNEDLFRIGIDIGSTTVKVVALDKQGKMLARAYVRHFSEVRASVARNVAALAENGILSSSDKVAVVITGSGGVGMAEVLGYPFVQEVIACARAIEVRAPHTDVAIELGGEDAKITFFTNGVEQRMNGSCAGGTGHLSTRWRPCNSSVNDCLLCNSISKSSVTDATSPCRAIALSAARLRVTNDLEME